ncbi:tetratricopeptide repeat protein [Labilibacter marinus]|uniref:tetratricopeptide repeat protein n=1 Tax=Labilibacter marinus TaxID=1477105 RepID=UPI00094FF14E|nr:hypothetical protein [Labilibacter marinus]
MIGKYIRLIIAVVICAGSVFLFMEGFIGWGVTASIISALFVLFHFKNEANLMAFFFVRKNKFAKAEAILATVKKPENLIKSQEAYYYFLTGLIEGQKHQNSKAEKSLKKALKTGLRTNSDQAMAKLNLSGIYLSQRNKKLATYYLKETKKLDKRKMMTAQIKEIEGMMKRI